VLHDPKAGQRARPPEPGRPAVALIGALTADWPAPSASARLEPPLGILQLAAILQARGIPSELVDLNALWARSGNSSRRLVENTVSRLRESPPPILGLSTVCSTYPLTLRLARRLKREFPDAPVVLGGPQASVVDVATLKAFPFVDFVLRGEAEEAFPLLVNYILTGGPPVGVPGLTHRDGSEVRRNPDAEPIRDLDALPLPSFDAYADVAQWPSLPLEIGRGCPFSCRFCSTSLFFRRRFRLKSTECVIRQMDFLSRRHGVRSFELIHDMFTVDRRRVVEFCQRLVELGAPYRWTCSARTDAVDRALLTLMRDAGCSGIFFGVETGSPRLQRVIRKNLDLKRARMVLDDCARLGIGTTASLIIGYPGETAADLGATLSFFVRTTRTERSVGQLHLLAPLPGTSLEAEYRSRLTLDPTATAIPEFGAGQGTADRLLIRKHPEIFGHFYAFPDRVRSAELLSISAFFANLQQRCRGLLIALADGQSKPLELFDAWIRWGGDGGASIDFYRQLEFVRAFLAFVRKAYVGKGRTAVDVMWRFYAALLTHRTPGEKAIVADRRHYGDCPAPAFVRLSPAVRIVSIRGDVVRVLKSLRRGRRPPPDCLERRTTVILTKSADGRSEVRELPPLAAAILGCLDGSFDEIVRKLTARKITWEDRMPAEFLPDALRILEHDGFVTRSAAA
jgi:radical SAM superfamily enzyme YgiQ (UPF0313 family)